MTQPNIIFIMADDLGYADVSCYGQRDYDTPAIDKIAADGVQFLQGYANSAVCSATRVSLMTGRYQYRLPVGLEEPIRTQERGIGFPGDHPSLPSILKKSGYNTALVGKWHLGQLPKFGPLKCGYDYFFGILGGAADYFNHGANSYSQLHEQDVPVERHGYITNLIGEKAVETIGGFARAKDPFFLSVHFTAPHWPWEGPDDEAVSKQIKNSTPSMMHYDGGTQRTYAKMVRAMDQNISRILQALDSRGLTRDTIIVFTSDNGGERFSKTWPFTGIKAELLEGGLRVPMIVRWPARIAAGQVSPQVVMTMDWMPTLLSAAGASPDTAYPPDGHDLVPILVGDKQPFPRKVFWRYKAAAQRAVRDNDWKYLRLAGNEFLFDVDKDPRERANLKDKHPDVFERLKADWDAWNETMLPERSEPAPYPNTGNVLADHYGVSNN